ncbi:MAG: hypothetical protein LBV67_02820 [Streptococcaceae bacterium]|nr:hypothetical protein [Streptococcaceae bacterium]
MTIQLKSQLYRGELGLKEIHALFDQKQEFLVKDMTQEKIHEASSAGVEVSDPIQDTEEIQALMKQVNENSKQINELSLKAQIMFDKQTEVNKLFTEPALNGSETSNDQILAKDIKPDSLTALEKYLATKEVDTPFKKKIRDLVAAAKTQLTDIETAKKAVEASEKEKENRELNNKAIEAVNKIKNPEIQKSYLDKLNPIKDELDKKDEEKKKIEESKSQEVAQEQANQTGQPVYNQNTGTYVQPSSPVYNPGNDNSGYTPTPQQPSNPGNTGGGNSTQPPQNNGNGGGIVAPPPQRMYTAYWEHINGQTIIVGTFSTWAAAATAAENAAWANEDVCISFGVME